MTIDCRTLAVIMSAAWLFGCGAEATEPEPEPSEQSTSPLGASCVGSIEAPVGSAAWRAELDACIDKATQQPAKPKTPPSGGNGQSCRTGIQCTNGACVCTDGPRAGQSCDGSTSTSAKSCSVACKVCE